MESTAAINPIRLKAASDASDIVIIGGGAIGLFLALELRTSGASVLVLERGQPGKEASGAAGGMLAWCDPALHPQLQTLAKASAALYPEFAERALSEVGQSIDLRTGGTLLLQKDLPSSPEYHTAVLEPAESQPEWKCGSKYESKYGAAVVDREVLVLEPNLTARGWQVFQVPEASLDPRRLVCALTSLAVKAGVRIATGSPVLAITSQRDGGWNLVTPAGTVSAPVVVNCAGAWASQLTPSFPTSTITPAQLTSVQYPLPIRPLKGHMLALADPGNRSLRHVVRSPNIYLIPRSEVILHGTAVVPGRIVIGSTVEEAGFDKSVDKEVIHRLHMAALRLVPALAGLRIVETWAGLRPGTPDGLPLLGPTSLSGYFAATGHYRDGILLAPITARVMAEIILGKIPAYDISPFSPLRFQHE